MHLTDEQLNEYLDHEAKDRPQIEIHVAACEECSARLAALRGLFFEIESLPETELSQDVASRFHLSPSHSAELPRSLTLTVILQAVLTVFAMIIASPFIIQFISWNIHGFSAPSPVDVFMQLQSQWTAWFNILSTLPIPSLPQVPVFNVSSLFVIFTIIGVSLLWLIGNGLLLRNQMK